jgi:hypothetical protein
MRTLIVATLFALGLGLVGIASSSAAPTNYTAIPQATNEGSNLVQKIWWNRYGQWCSRRCNWRRCFVVCR